MSDPQHPEQPPAAHWGPLDGPPPAPPWAPGQQAQFGAPAPDQPAAMPYLAQPKPDANLAWAILSTVLCCLPLGVVAVVYSTQVDSKWNAGDFAGAERASRLARNYSIASAAVSAVLAVAYFVFVAVVLAGTTPS